jgi:hypothetical protein
MKRLSINYSSSNKTSIEEEQEKGFQTILQQMHRSRHYFKHIDTLSNKRLKEKRNVSIQYRMTDPAYSE